jgi:CHAT domain-containing protein
VTKGGVESVELAGRDVLKDLVSHLTKASSGPDTVFADTSYWKAATAVSDVLIRPLAAKISRSRLVVIPDDVLQQVAFAGLPWPGSKWGVQPMVERFSEIVTLPSASALAAMRNAHSQLRPDKEIAIFADPHYGPNRERLKASADEATQIAAMVGGQKKLVLTGVDASLANVTRAHLELYRNLLFAAHAIVDFKRPELSGVVLSEMDAEGKARNGTLRLLDIYRLKLNSDVVMLSACQSGEGKDVAGEGAVALSRGFLYAGARSVIATLWDVHDRPAATLVHGVFAHPRALDFRP